jgi:hypothetical protein
MATTTSANDNNQHGYEEELAAYEKDLADYLQERIKPGLSRSAIPLLARSIAKEITRREPPEPPTAQSQASDDQPDPQGSDEQPDAEASDEQLDAQASDEQPDADTSDEQPDFETDMHELQADLGVEWILRFSVHGEDGWLTAEKQDATQRVEAPDAQRLVTIVEAINEGGGRQA